MKRVRTPLLAASVIGSLAAAGLAAAPSAQANDRHAVPRTKPAWVGQAHSLGAAPAKGASTFRVYLAPKGGLAAQKTDLAAISTPGNARYGKFITPSQFHAAYDPTSATVKQVRSFLASAHLKVTGVAAHRSYLSVRGANADVAKALGTRIATFQHDGQTVQANTTGVSVPASVGSSVLTVTGLDTTVHTMKHHDSNPPPPAGFNNGRPCSIAYGDTIAKTQADGTTPLPKFLGNYLPYAVCGYRGSQFRAAYQGANAKHLNGAGTTIAILDAYASPTQPSDAQQYAQRQGDGAYAKGQYTQVAPSTFTHQDECEPSGWWGEEALDIEAEHAMAPGANIRYYGAKSCYDDDFLNAIKLINKQNQADIVSNSWGDLGEEIPQGEDAAYDQAFIQGAMQGITYTFSSGDNGDEVGTTGIRQADFPATSPNVTAVGGTADAIQSTGSFKFQTGWGTNKYSLDSKGASWIPNGFLYGAGGGQSTLFNKPTYQQGVVPASYGGGRQVPDVAMDADPNTGMLIGLTQTFTDGVRYGEYRIGGTSLASPLFVGQTALLEQNNGSGRLGLLNPLLYGGKLKGVLTDITGAGADAGNVRVDFVNGEDPKKGLTYSVRTFNQDSSLKTNPGWDEVTGLGSPNASYINATVPKK